MAGNSKGARPTRKSPLPAVAGGAASPGKGGRPQCHGFKTRNTRPHSPHTWLDSAEGQLPAGGTLAREAGRSWLDSGRCDFFEHGSEPMKEGSRPVTPRPQTQAGDGAHRRPCTWAGTRNPAPSRSCKEPCQVLFQLPIVPSIRSHPKTQ